MTELRIVLACCVCWASAACGLAGPVDVEVRLQNGSSSTYAAATLYTADGPVTYTDLAPGSTSFWTRVSMAYRIATTEVVVESDTVRLQVIDYVGEEPLPAGCYTYVVGLEPATGSPTSLTQSIRDDC